ncbi:unnamed protein product [Moneuplotes crassus]|uniref:Uncharacterized protein n=1 Tax=Euplotes crassus TaxID=5936 RepID=A0AAD1X730_EUPCR|nr:unnamed protein product [Moneuplotes crassus]
MNFDVGIMRAKMYKEDGGFRFQEGCERNKPSLFIEKVLTPKGVQTNPHKSLFTKPVQPKGNYASNKDWASQSQYFDHQSSLIHIPQLISSKIKVIYKKKEKYESLITDINYRINANKLEIRRLKAKISAEERKHTTMDGKRLIKVKNSTLFLHIKPLRPSQCLSSCIEKHFGAAQRSSRLRCYNTVAYSTFTELGLKLAPQEKKYFYYEVLDGNHTFFSKKYDWNFGAEIQDQLPKIQFNWKLKTGNENVKIRLYSETVTKTSSGACSTPKYSINAEIIGEVEFPLKKNLMSLAHQEKISKHLTASGGSPETVSDAWDGLFSFDIQWIHNIYEYRLKREFSKLHALEKEKENILLKHKNVTIELESLQQEDGVGVFKKLLTQSQSLNSLPPKASEGCRSRLNYSSDDEWENLEVNKDSNTNCSSTQKSNRTQERLQPSGNNPSSARNKAFRLSLVGSMMGTLMKKEDPGVSTLSLDVGIPEEE